MWSFKVSHTLTSYVQRKYCTKCWELPYYCIQAGMPMILIRANAHRLAHTHTHMLISELVQYFLMPYFVLWYKYLGVNSHRWRQRLWIITQDKAKVNVKEVPVLSDVRCIATSDLVSCGCSRSCVIMMLSKCRSPIPSRYVATQYLAA